MRTVGFNEFAAGYQPPGPAGGDLARPSPRQPLHGRTGSTPWYVIHAATLTQAVSPAGTASARLSSPSHSGVKCSPQQAAHAAACRRFCCVGSCPKALLRRFRSEPYRRILRSSGVAPGVLPVGCSWARGTSCPLPLSPGSQASGPARAFFFMSSFPGLGTPRCR